MSITALYFRLDNGLFNLKVCISLRAVVLLIMLADGLSLYV
jgi:hypothetical protein